MQLERGCLRGYVSRSRLSIETQNVHHPPLPSPTPVHASSPAPRAEEHSEECQLRLKCAHLTHPFQ